MVSRFSIRLKHFATAENVYNLKNASSKSEGLIQNCKNTINSGNTFYKGLVGMDKIERQREELITLKGKMITAKEKLEIADGLLKKTQYDMKRLEGEISRTDRIKHYEKFAELLKKESELKIKEDENLQAVKTSEYKRDLIQTKVDTTKTAILMLEKDHSTYQLWLKFFFLFLGLFTSGYYIRDNKRILAGLEEIKRINRSSGGFEFSKFCGILYRGTVDGLYWGCKKTYGGLKCVANVSWNTSKWAAVEGADKTVRVSKWGYGYVSWAACSGYNQAKKLVYGDQK